MRGSQHCPLKLPYRLVNLNLSSYGQLLRLIWASSAWQFCGFKVATKGETTFHMYCKIDPLQTTIKRHFSVKAWFSTHILKWNRTRTCQFWHLYWVCTVGLWSTGRQFKQFKNCVIRSEFSTVAFDWIYHQNCFLFWKIISKLHNKDDKINVFCLPWVNCVISFHLDGFGMIIVVHSSSSSSVVIVKTAIERIVKRVHKMLFKLIYK